jgi:hypothetical protein
VAKIFQEKYFHTGSFLDSALGFKPSYMPGEAFGTLRSFSRKGLLFLSNQFPIRILNALIDADKKWGNIPLIQEMFNTQKFVVWQFVLQGKGIILYRVGLEPSPAN